MPFPRLAPVGQPLTFGTERPLPVPPAGCSLTLTQSGTAALGLALLLARLRKPVPGTPEVLLPGYGCPDLLAAAHWAGLRPRLVDLRPNDTMMALDDLRARITASTVAILAVNFLGIAEDLATLRAIADEADLLLVEDDAQWLPEPFAAPPLLGDAVITSFGRGKPVPLVGGGALLLRGPHAATLQAALPPLPEPAGSALRARLALLAYGIVLQPWVYGVLSRLPIGLGRTRYHALHGVEALDALRAGQLARNIELQCARERTRERWLRETVVPRLPGGSIDLVAAAGARAGRLLRYPVLLPDRARRDALCDALERAGLGASRMYVRVLPEVDGVPAGVDAPALTNARAFADRLLTLPVHAHVNARHIARMAAACAAVR